MLAVVLRRLAVLWTAVIVAVLALYGVSRPWVDAATPTTSGGRPAPVVRPHVDGRAAPDVCRTLGTAGCLAELGRQQAAMCRSVGLRAQQSGAPRESWPSCPPWPTPTRLVRVQHATPVKDLDETRG
jgi:hypothetical protein